MHCLFLVIMECISSPSRRKLNYQNMLYNINSTWYEICNFAIVVTNLSSRTSILECSTMFSEIEILIYLLHILSLEYNDGILTSGHHQDRLVSIFYFYFLGRGGKKSCLVTNYIKIKILLIDHEIRVVYTVQLISVVLTILRTWQQMTGKF